MDQRLEIQRMPVAVFFMLVFAISWAGSLALGAPRLLQGVTMQLEDVWLIGMAMLLTPCALGIAMTAVVSGGDGLLALLASLKQPLPEKRWYAAPLIFPILILVTQAMMAVAVSPDYVPNFYAPGILIGILAGFLEETGWMGFAFPRMNGRASALRAAILLGVIHVLWHLAADYVSASAVRGVYWLPRFVAFGAAMVAMRLILVWVYVNTRSLLMAQLMHASSTGFLSILVSLSLSPAQDALFYVAYGVLLWIAAFVIMERYGRQLDGTKRQTTNVKVGPA